MTGSVALDVVIGLVFIYLLYSLFATLIAEIIATNLSLRAKNLREGINRMINDDVEKDGRFSFLKELINITPKKATNALIKNFYEHQEVKYLGRKASHNPSAIKSSNFAKVILDKIKAVGQGETEYDQLKSGLKKLSTTAKEEVDHYVNEIDRIMGPETAGYIRSILQDCENRIEETQDKIQDAKNIALAFKAELENWFDRTMDQTTEWYKQRMQKILLIIGFLLAWFFNADTFSIIKKLSYDKDAREKVVQLASAYIQNNSYDKYALLTADSTALADTTRYDSASLAVLKAYTSQAMTYNDRLDTLFGIKKSLENDMTNAHSVLGLGAWLPDSVGIKNGTALYPDWVEEPLANKVISIYQTKHKHIQISWWDKVQYMLLLLIAHPAGYFITALAVSLGAPFWFDLLSKLMKLRGTMTGE